MTKRATDKHDDGTRSGRRRQRRASAAPASPTQDGNIRLNEDGLDNEYARAVDAGHRVDPRVQKILAVLVALVAIYFLGLLIPKNLLNEALHQSGYNAGYTFSWFVQDLMDNVNGLIGVFTGNDAQTGVTPFSSTMLRYVIIMLAGAGLALCGAVYQGSFRNALVSPSSLGVMSGSALGMVVWVLFFVNDEGDNIPWLTGDVGAAVEGSDLGSYLLSTYSLSLFSFVGCSLVVLMVLAAMRAMGRGSSGLMIIIVGQVIGGVAGAITNTVRYFYTYTDPYGVKASLLTDLQIASFYRSYGVIDIVAVGVPILACFALVMHFRQKMMVLAFGEEEARSMGVESRRVQYAVVGLCTLLTAVIVSFCGHIGFVGFLVPHLARRVVGPNFSYLLPAAMAIGALFVLVAYLLVAILLGPDYETMSGMYISIGGAVVFLVTALRGDRGMSGRGF